MTTVRRSGCHIYIHEKYVYEPTYCHYSSTCESSGDGNRCIGAEESRSARWLDMTEAVQDQSSYKEEAVGDAHFLQTKHGPHFKTGS